VRICFSFFAEAQCVHVLVASVEHVLYNRMQLKNDVNNKIELKTFHTDYMYKYIRPISLFTLYYPKAPDYKSSKRVFPSISNNAIKNVQTKILRMSLLYSVLISWTQGCVIVCFGCVQFMQIYKYDLLKTCHAIRLQKS
jgi:hypothetical protein